MSNTELRGLLPRTLTLVLLLCACVAAAQDSSDAPDYRLAGIVAVGPERFLAVIEMPDGRQGLFRAGDALGDGRIREVSRTGVRVELDGHDVLLSLRGNPNLSAATPIAADDELSPDEPQGDPTVRNQPLFYEDTVKLLTSVARATAAASPASVAATASQNVGASADALSARLGELLGVPAGARIVAVDNGPVRTPQEVIDAVIPRLGQGRAVRLTLTGAGDLQVVYLTPVEEE